jgi:hypothetical protein
MVRSSLVFMNLKVTGMDLSVIVVLDGTNSDDGVQEVWSDHRLFL